MIEINLVPQHLQKRKRKSGGLARLNIPREVIVGMIGGFIVLLVIVSVLLQMTIFKKFAKLKGLKSEWEEVSPSKNRVDGVTGQLRKLQGKVKAIEEITGKNAVNWAEKLNMISSSLPRGVWLTRVVINERILLIEGSAVSKGRDEMISVHKFGSELKNQEGFLDQLTNFEVGSIQRRNIKSIEIADFKITADIKQ